MSNVLEMPPPSPPPSPAPTTSDTYSDPPVSFTSSPLRPISPSLLFSDDDDSTFSSPLSDTRSSCTPASPAPLSGDASLASTFSSFLETAFPPGMHLQPLPSTFPVLDAQPHAVDQRSTDGTTHNSSDMTFPRDHHAPPTDPRQPPPPPPENASASLPSQLSPSLVLPVEIWRLIFETRLCDDDETLFACARVCREWQALILSSFPLSMRVWACTQQPIPSLDMKLDAELGSHTKEVAMRWAMTPPSRTAPTSSLVRSKVSGSGQMRFQNPSAHATLSHGHKCRHRIGEDMSGLYMTGPIIAMREFEWSESTRRASETYPPQPTEHHRSSNKEGCLLRRGLLVLSSFNLHVVEWGEDAAGSTGPASVSASASSSLPSLVPGALHSWRLFCDLCTHACVDAAAAALDPFSEHDTGMKNKLESLPTHSLPCCDGRPPPCHLHHVSLLSMHHEDNIIFTSGGDARVHVWLLSLGGPQHPSSQPEGAQPNDPDGCPSPSSRSKASLQLLEVLSKDVCSIWCVAGERRPRSVALGGESKHLANPSTADPRHQHAGTANSANSTGSSYFLYTGSGDGVVRVWYCRDWNPLVVQPHFILSRVVYRSPTREFISTLTISPLLLLVGDNHGRVIAISKWDIQAAVIEEYISEVVTEPEETGSAPSHEAASMSSRHHGGFKCHASAGQCSIDPIEDSDHHHHNHAYHRHDSRSGSELPRLRRLQHGVYSPPMVADSLDFRARFSGRDGRLQGNAAAAAGNTGTSVAHAVGGSVASGLHGSAPLALAQEPIPYTLLADTHTRIRSLRCCCPLDTTTSRNPEVSGYQYMYPAPELLLLTTGNDGHVRVWHMSSAVSARDDSEKRIKGQFLIEAGPVVPEACFHKGSLYIIALTLLGRVYLWSHDKYLLEGDRASFTYLPIAMCDVGSPPRTVRSLSVITTGECDEYGYQRSHVAVGDFDGCISVWPGTF